VLSWSIKLFGPPSEDPEGTPPLPELVYDGATVKPGVLVERLDLRGARVLANYDDGSIAVTEHVYGSGMARLVGTSLGVSYTADPGPATSHLMCDLALGVSAEPRVTVDAPRVEARYLMVADDDGGGGLLYVVNPTFQRTDVSIKIASRIGAFRQALDLVTNTEREWKDGGVSLSLGARDGTVLRLLA